MGGEESGGWRGITHLSSLANISKNLSPAGGQDFKSSPPVVAKGVSRAACHLLPPIPPPTHTHSYVYPSIKLAPFLDNVAILAHCGCLVFVSLYQEGRSTVKQQTYLACHQGYNWWCLSPLWGTFRWPV